MPHVEDLQLKNVVRLPGIVLVAERHGPYDLTDKIDRKRHREEGFHLTRMEVQLLWKKKVERNYLLRKKR